MEEDRSVKKVYLGVASGATGRRPRYRRIDAVRFDLCELQGDSAKRSMAFFGVGDQDSLWVGAGDLAAPGNRMHACSI